MERCTMPRILVIDDEAQVRNMLCEMLRRADYEVDDASDGDIGLDKVSQSEFDLVITDLIMPEREGIGTIIELRREHPDLKIIAISGGGRIDPENYLEAARNLGVSRTFAKPFRKNEMLDAIAEVLAE